MQKVKGREGLVKDPSTGAVINVDSNAYRAAKAAKKRILESKRKEEELEERIESMDERVRNMESTLEKILDVVSRNGEKNE